MNAIRSRDAESEPTLRRAAVRQSWRDMEALTAQQRVGAEQRLPVRAGADISDRMFGS